MPALKRDLDGYGSPRFLEVAQGFHPHGIPWSEARGGAGVAVKKVKRYLAKMDKAVNYDYYDDDELRYTRFKSPFDRRPLIDRRTRHRKNEGKRTLRLIGSSTADYMRAMRHCEEDDDWEDEV
ncbi:hypothetical protein GQ55_7G233400 [Panicum hallii var. hallii]|uniref:Uncharacterized protein n=1 Tax=Panicum hallii var. hallii TaxID=1504633 RepID=A0A2T7CY75_9POAL|nr:hypothetical protein GQ55_7G233400 [Panicum hallii var. hallii]